MSDARTRQLARDRQRKHRAAKRLARPTRRCSRCNADKPMTDFNDHLKEPRVRVGMCRPCRKSWEREHPADMASAEAARRRLVYHARHVQARTRVCTECRVVFVGQANRLTCSSRCRDRRQARLNPYGTKARNARKSHKRRGLLAQAGSDQLAALLRAAVTCPLCGVTYTDQAMQPTSREIDHILPLAAGGTHALANLRVTCRRCNLARPRDGSDVVAHA